VGLGFGGGNKLLQATRGKRNINRLRIMILFLMEFIDFPSFLEISEKSRNLQNLCNPDLKSLPAGRQVCHQESVEPFFRALLSLKSVKGYSVRSFYPTRYGVDLSTSNLIESDLPTSSP
jgi:hypothetical protein